MIVENVKLEITREQYAKILSELRGRCYGNYKGLNVFVYQSMNCTHYMELVDYIDNIRR